MDRIGFLSPERVGIQIRMGIGRTRAERHQILDGAEPVPGEAHDVVGIAGGLGVPIVLGIAVGLGVPIAARFSGVHGFAGLFIEPFEESSSACGNLSVV